MNENFRSIGLDTQDKIVAFISWSCQFTDDNGFIYERFRSEESRRYETSGRYYWIRENQFFISTPPKKKIFNLVLEKWSKNGVLYKMFGV